LIKINEQFHTPPRLLRLNEPEGRAPGTAEAMPKQVLPPFVPLQEGSEACELDNGARHLVDQAALAAFFKLHATRRRVGTDRVLPDFHEFGLSLAMVTSGMLIAAMDLPDNRRQILFVYCPGDVIFADALTRVGAVGLRTLSDVELSVISETSLMAARQARAETVQTLLEVAVRHLSDLMLHSAALGRLKTDERVATFFLEFALHLGTVHHGTATMDLGMRREDIADYLGLNPDTLSRAISRLRRERVVTFVNAGRVIVHLDALSERTPLGPAMRAGLATARREA
jgi:CRP/FNR family transcriptional regulator